MECAGPCPDRGGHLLIMHSRPGYHAPFRPPAVLVRHHRSITVIQPRWRRSRATENSTVVKQVLADPGKRRVDFEVPRVYIVDGGKALLAGVRHAAGNAANCATLSGSQGP
jgi:hypothetical protein